MRPAVGKPVGSGLAATGSMTRRIALVGLSWIATDLPPPASDPTLGTAIPYSHASAVAAIPELELVAGCDISAAARDDVPATAGPAASPA